MRFRCLERMSGIIFMVQMAQIWPKTKKKCFTKMYPGGIENLRRGFRELPPGPFGSDMPSSLGLVSHSALNTALHSCIIVNYSGLHCTSHSPLSGQTATCRKTKVIRLTPKMEIFAPKWALAAAPWPPVLQVQQKNHAFLVSRRDFGPKNLFFSTLRPHNPLFWPQTNPIK